MDKQVLTKICCYSVSRDVAEDRTSRETASNDQLLSNYFLGLLTNSWTPHCAKGFEPYRDFL